MPRRRPRIPTDKSLPHKERFLISFRKWGMQSKALTDADLTLKQLKAWMEEDEAFAAQFDDILEELELETKEELEAVALKRAVTRSDQLIKFLLGKLDPTYRERSEIEHKGNVQIVYRENLNLEEL